MDNRHNRINAQIRVITISSALRRRAFVLHAGDKLSRLRYINVSRVANLIDPYRIWCGNLLRERLTLGYTIRKG